MVGPEIDALAPWGMPVGHTDFPRRKALRPCTNLAVMLIDLVAFLYFCCCHLSTAVACY